MATWNSLAVATAALITFLSMAEGFFLYSNSNNNKKTNPGLQSLSMNLGDTDAYVELNCRSPSFQVADPSTDRQFSPPPTNFYRDIGPVQSSNWGAQYAFDGTGPVTVALPVAVPIQSQMGSVPPSLRGTVHNVQLVPCLCPVSRDVDSSYLSSPPVKQNPQVEQLQQLQQTPTAYIVQSQQAPSQPT